MPNLNYFYSWYFWIHSQEIPWNVSCCSSCSLFHVLMKPYPACRLYLRKTWSAHPRLLLCSACLSIYLITNNITFLRNEEAIRFEGMPRLRCCCGGAVRSMVSILRRWKGQISTCSLKPCLSKHDTWLLVYRREKGQICRCFKNSTSVILPQCQNEMRFQR